MQRKSSRGNPNHYPKGTPRGGQFAPKGVGMTINHSDEYYEAKTSLRNGSISEAEFEKAWGKDTRFVPAKTRAEAEEFTRSLGVRPYFKGLDIDTCNECNRALAETLNEFPEIKKDIRVIGSGQEINKEIKRRLKPIIAAEFQEKYEGSFPQSAIDRGVKKTLNQYGKRMDGYAYFSRKNLRAGASSEKAEIMNEYSGIYLHTKNMHSANATRVDYTRDVARRFHPENTSFNATKAIIDHELGHAIDHAYGISEKVNTRGKTKDEIANGLSRYALENNREYVAEAWCEYRNSPTPRKIAIEVGEIIEGVKA